MPNLSQKDCFDKQLATLIEKGYAKAMGLSSEDFLDLLSPLKQQLPDKDFEISTETGFISFVIVVKLNKISPAKALALVDFQEKAGVEKLFPLNTSDFETIDTVLLPQGQAYLLMDIDRGSEYLNVTPAEAFSKITKKGRSPLTIDEGIAIITHFPDFLVKNNCFSLLASRHQGDKRVPAIWINSNKQPNLGWCWEGNPHTWLGSASCGSRI